MDIAEKGRDERRQKMRRRRGQALKEGGFFPGPGLSGGWGGGKKREGNREKIENRREGKKGTETRCVPRKGPGVRSRPTKDSDRKKFLRRMERGGGGGGGYGGPIPTFRTQIFSRKARERSMETDEKGREGK